MARTIEFDRSEVLQKAMELFWSDGYCKTSVSNLVFATKLKPGSIYAAFNSKEGLFLAALDFYGQHHIEIFKNTLAHKDSPLEGIKHYFLDIFNEIKNDKNKGCFLVNTALEITPDNIVITNEVNKHLLAKESMFHSALIEAQRKGELPKDKKPKDLAKFLMISLWGLRVFAKTNPSKKSVEIIKNQLFLSFE